MKPGGGEGGGRHCFKDVGSPACNVPAGETVFPQQKALCFLVVREALPARTGGSTEGLALRGLHLLLSHLWKGLRCGVTLLRLAAAGPSLRACSTPMHRLGVAAQPLLLPLSLQAHLQAGRCMLLLVRHTTGCCWRFCKWVLVATWRWLQLLR